MGWTFEVSRYIPYNVIHCPCLLCLAFKIKCGGIKNYYTIVDNTNEMIKWSVRNMLLEHSLPISNSYAE